MMGMRGMSNMLGEIGMQIGLVGGSFAAGWQIGTLLREIPLVQKFSDDVAESWRDMHAELENSGSALRSIREEMERIKDVAIASVIGEIAGFRSGKDEKEDAESRLRSATAAAEPNEHARIAMEADNKYWADMERIRREEVSAWARLNKAGEDDRKMGEDQTAWMAEGHSGPEEIKFKENIAERARKNAEASQEALGKLAALEIDKKTAKLEQQTAYAKAMEGKEPGGTKTTEPKLEKATPLDIASDRLSRIGGYLGGTDHADLAKRTATFTERTAKAVEKMKDILSTASTSNTTLCWGD
jgi:hypothetical protein